MMAALARWLAAAEADADRRGLPELKPLLRGMAPAIQALRETDWPDEVDDEPATRSRRMPDEGR